MELNKDADPNCKACHGYGLVSIGTICTGFGGEPESIECMCVLYKKIGMNPETGERKK